MTDIVTINVTSGSAVSATVTVTDHGPDHITVTERPTDASPDYAGRVWNFAERGEATSHALMLAGFGPLATSKLGRTWNDPS